MATVFGGWNYDEVKSCNLPQKAQSAFTAVTSELAGADYEPVAYLGSQKVNGTNYCIIALKKPVVLNGTKSVVKLIIHTGLDGAVKLEKISRITM